MDLQFMDDLLADSTEWQITDDSKADWAIEKINDAVAERDRLVKIAQDKIKDLQEKMGEAIARCNNNTQFLTDKLYFYFQTVKPTETKTQKTYKLLSGKLVLKHQQPEYLRDDLALLDWAKNNGPEYIQIKSSVNWAELKKRTVTIGEQVALAETGEVIPGVVAKARDDIFEVSK